MITHGVRVNHRIRVTSCELLELEKRNSYCYRDDGARRGRLFCVGGHVEGPQAIQVYIWAASLFTWFSVHFDETHTKQSDHVVTGPLMLKGGPRWSKLGPIGWDVFFEASRSGFQIPFKKFTKFAP